MHLALLVVFSATIFVSAMLLFMVQPLVGKLLLPYLGGTPAVWNTCMVFFQALLLGGYFYAHRLKKIPSLRVQLIIQGSILLLALIPLAIFGFRVDALARSVLPTPTESNPIPWLLSVLLVTTGLPFFVVSTTAPLLQRWFAGTSHPSARDPYFLYAASNLGSMSTLLAYPFLIEPALSIGQQALAWTFGFIIYGLLVGACGWLASTNRATLETVEGVASQDKAPGWATVMGWVALAFIPSSLMIGCTTHLTTDIAPIPLLWILPLALYLLSFILVFSRIPGWIYLGASLLLPLGVLLFQSGAIDEVFRSGNLESIIKAGHSGIQLKAIELILLLGVPLLAGIFGGSPNRQHIFWVLLLPLSLLLVTALPGIKRTIDIPEQQAILWHLALLLSVSMVCHGELARDRPSPSHLTSFYLAMSFGGVLGGIFNTMVAPLAFNRVVEYPLVAAMACLMIPGFDVSKGMAWLRGVTQTAVAATGAGVGLLLLAAGFVPVENAREWASAWLPRDKNALYAWVHSLIDNNLSDRHLLEKRNFFGSFTIQESSHPVTFWFPLAETEVHESWTYHKMLHGTTNHGMQVYAPEHMRRETVTYFHKAGAIGQLFESAKERQRRSGRPQRVAVLGVGTGTLAAYAEKDWTLTLFEIDPEVVTTAYRDPQERYFTFLRDAERRGAKVEVKLGDGRKLIERHDAADGKFDILFMDAFASDSVPVHLLTREAFQSYFNKLEDDGMVVVNIANRYLNFEPVLANLAESMGWSMLIQGGYGIDRIDKYGTNWVVISRKREDTGILPDLGRRFDVEGEEPWFESWRPGEAKPALGVWTDDYSNIVGIFKWAR
ncbi:MAG: hypothetical protein FJ261_05175 [Planctomycetes bacterium]|nr:hypothetical protein [Planctomycetota bacterium]